MTWYVVRSAAAGAEALVQVFPNIGPTIKATPGRAIKEFSDHPFSAKYGWIQITG
jgi:hypothetical protein